jgi:S-adenosylmethionine hydrolase
MARYDWVSLITDYGLSDGFVGALHGVIAQRAPHARFIDITHLVTPGDVARGAAVLAQTVTALPRAVHVGVVDPGVGTDRRAVALQTPRGLLVGPDNGLLVPAGEALGGITRAVHLTRSDWFAARVSATFHGRDIFGPVAGRLAAGADMAEGGPEIDPQSLVRLPEPILVVGDDWIEAEVLTVDRFGNVQLVATARDAEHLPDEVEVSGMLAERATTFGAAPHGRLLLLVDSAGHLALAINGGRAAVALSVSPGDVLRLNA